MEGFWFDLAHAMLVSLPVAFRFQDIRAYRVRLDWALTAEMPTADGDQPEDCNCKPLDT